jgi:PAS domain S-box-containing protein
MHGRPTSPIPSFLGGGGETGALIRAYDWSASPLRAPASWPQPLKTLVGVMLGSAQPMFIAWGPERIMLYNQGYAPLLGQRHPEALGRPFAEVWHDILDTVGPIMNRTYAGESIHMDDISFIMHRHGYPEEAHFSFSYTPVRDDEGHVTGMFCACNETTEEVKARSALKAERERLRELFQQAPGFMCVLTGPEHVFEIVNDSYLQLIGHRRGVIGQSARKALLEIAGQGFFELLDKVFATGEPFVGRSMAVSLQREAGGPTEKRFVDLVYQPITNTDGKVTGIFAEGSDVTERVHAEMALRESGAQHRQIIDSATDYAIIASDMDGRVTSWNTGAQHLLGWTEEEMLGRPVDVFFTPEDVAAGQPRKEMQDARRYGRAIDERWHQRKGGERFWASGELTPLRDDRDVVKGFVKVMRDRTEQRQAESVLAASRAQTLEILESISDAFYAVDHEWRFTYINRKAEEWWGRRRDDLIGKVYRDEFPKAVGSEPYRAHQKAMQEREPIRLEAVSPILHRWVDISIFPTGDGGLSVYFRDISERRRAEETLRQYAVLVESMTEGVSLSDEHGIIVYTNPAEDEMFGYGLGELIGRHVTAQNAYEPGENSRRVEAVIAELKAKGFWEGEWRNRRKDGSEFITASRITAIELNGRPHWLCVQRDITEAKRAEEHQRLLINELNHRVKNTLTTVQSLATQTFKNEHENAASRLTFEGRLFALAVAHDVLTKEQWEGAELRDIVSEALAPYTQGDDARFEINGPEVRLPPRMALAIAMALHELATNAVKYGALSVASGRVVIDWKTTSGRPKYLTLRWQEGGGPQVTPPTRKGFGTRLIERSLALELGGDVRLSYEPAGIVCSVKAPLEYDERSESGRHPHEGSG